MFQGEDVLGEDGLLLPALGNAGVGLAELAQMGAIPKFAGAIGSMISKAEKTRLGYGNKTDSMVRNPERNAYPGIYDNPKELVAEAVSRVDPESPLLKRLFGVTRDDLWEIGQQGKRKGNITEQPFKSAPKGKGSKIVDQLDTPKNIQRLQDIIGEAEKHPELYQTMASWYVMDPLYQRMEKMFGKEEAVRRYTQFNAITGMASPGTDVVTELNRGTGANWLAIQDRFDDFLKHGGTKLEHRGKNFPDDMRPIKGHAYHKTAQAGPMSRYLESGGDMGKMSSAKVPSYVAASGVPETGFQTHSAVGDAHFVRAAGLADVRGRQTKKGVEVKPGKSGSVPEMVKLAPLFKNKVSDPMGIEAVPGQAILWGAVSGATGVDSAIGLGKLEILSIEIGKAAERMNVSPEKARDMILSGEAHAGFVTPELATALAAAGIASAAGYKATQGDGN
tara:strand:- start:81 stop:1424 length:1344 start_codon:yes stop_codon:yes gene_type:complete